MASPQLAANDTRTERGTVLEEDRVFRATEERAYRVARERRLIQSVDGPVETTIVEKVVLQKDLITEVADTDALGEQDIEVLFDKRDLDDVRAWVSSGALLSRPPEAPAIVKTIDAANTLRITVTQPIQRQINEKYRFDLWNAANTFVFHTISVTSAGTGSSRLRDKWAEWTAAQLTSAGYTPGPALQVYVDVVQVGDDVNSASIKQLI